MQNNECNHICEQFTEYQENSLAPELKAKVDTHLATCSSCQTVYQELNQVLDQLHQLPEIQTTPNFTNELLEKIKIQNEIGLWSKIYRSSYTRVASYAIAAGFVVALGLNVWIDPIMPGNQHRTGSIAGEQKPVSQNEETLLAHTDSATNGAGDSLLLTPGTINSSSSSLQLVNDTK